MKEKKLLLRKVLLSVFLFFSLSPREKKNGNLDLKIWSEKWTGNNRFY